MSRKFKHSQEAQADKKNNSTMSRARETASLKAIQAHLSVESVPTPVVLDGKLLAVHLIPHRNLSAIAYCRIFGLKD
eukprot:2266980-Amphidinium_carterae.1